MGSGDWVDSKYKIDFKIYFRKALRNHNGVYILMFGIVYFTLSHTYIYQKVVCNSFFSLKSLIIINIYKRRFVIILIRIPDLEGKQ